MQETQNGFDRLPLTPAALATLKQLGYLEMTAIQQEALPDALAGKDLIAQAETGSGKTAVFALLIANKIEISIDGVNRAFDNIYIEQFCRNLKYEDIFLNNYHTMLDLKNGVKRCMDSYNI